MSDPLTPQQEAEAAEDIGAHEPAVNIAITVARSMAGRGADVGPNVVSVLLARIDHLTAAKTSEAERIKRLVEAVSAFEVLHSLRDRFVLGLLLSEVGTPEWDAAQERVTRALDNLQEGDLDG